MTPRIGIIGFGAIAQDLVALLAAEGSPGALSVLVRPGRGADVKHLLQDIDANVETDITDRLEAFLSQRPLVVAECAGHGAVAEYGAAILAHGIDLIAASVGALADESLRASLDAAARNGGAQLIVPSGAIGGIDIVAAARLSGPTALHYTGRKPPRAWAGTPAERVHDLARLSEPTAIFEGSARAAASAYPKNANVAATLALAGPGMDDTRVRLVADPTTSENVHEFTVSSPAVEASVRLVGKPSPRNPKTSQTTALSIARAVLNRHSAVVI